MSSDDVQVLVLEQFRTINTKLDVLPGLQVKIDLLDKSSREMGAELRTRDHAQQESIEALRKEIAELRLDQHKMMAAIAGVSSTTTELNAGLENQRKQLATMEGQVKSLFDTTMQTRRQINDLDKSFQGVDAKVSGLVSQTSFAKLEKQVQTLDEEVCAKVSGLVPQTSFAKLEKQVQTLDDEAKENRPWINGIRAFLRITFYLAMTAMAGSALYWAAEAIIEAVK